MDCNKPEDRKKGAFIVFKKALIPNVVLGIDLNASPIQRAGHSEELHDIALSYTCTTRTWQLK